MLEYLPRGVSAPLLKNSPSQSRRGYLRRAFKRGKAPLFKTLPPLQTKYLKAFPNVTVWRGGLRG